jgi:hypothetical protein
MALGSEIVDFIGLDGSQDTIEGTGVVEIAIDQVEAPMRDMRIFIDRIDTTRIERTGPTDDAVDLVSLPQ